MRPSSPCAAVFVVVEDGVFFASLVFASGATVDARPSDNNVDPYGEGDAPTRKGTDEKWLRN